ncbi:MAG: YCF48-related protein [Bacteroidota bacterium]
MRKIFLIAIVIYSLNASTTIAQTVVPAGSVSGTWTIAGSPYLIQGSIQIPDGSTLTIQPGVTVNFQGHYKFNVQGRLLAIGTITDTITFTAANTTDGWKGIRYEDTPMINDSSKILFCKFQYGKVSGGSGYDTHGGALFLKNFSKVIISNCLISNCDAINGGGIYCFSSSNISIYYNTISNNTAIYGGGIYIDGCTPSVSNNIISNNTASYGGGFYFVYCSPSLINNTISNNSAVNGGAICCRLVGQPTFRNTILWGNTASTSGAQVFLETEDSDPNFYYCDVQGGTAAFGINGNIYSGTYQNNINSDPLFVAPSGGSGTGYNSLYADWSLQNTSPCIDAGEPNGTYPSTDIAGNPRVTVCRIDIGAYEYQTGIPLAVSLSVSQPILCNGAATAGIEASVSGGVAPYTYLWSTGDTTANINGLIAGTYTVTVSEVSYGCTLTKSIILTESPAISVYAGTDTSIICGGYVQLNANPQWATLNSNTTTNLSSVFFTDENTGYAVGNFGKILKTINGGADWTIQTNSISNGLNSVYFSNTDTGYSVGNGSIIKTTNGGTNWTQQLSGPPISMLNSVYFANSAIGYVAGDSANVGIILKTSNGGTNWTQQTIGTAPGLRSVYFINKDTGYVAGGFGTILKTSNGGTNWTQQTSGTNSQLRAVYFADANTGFAVGDGGTIVKTSNAGINWTSQVSGIGYLLCSVYFINTDTGYVAGDNGTILKTTNGGSSWVKQTGGATFFLRSVHFPDAVSGYAVGLSGKILKLPELVSYSWSPANGLNATDISNPKASPNATTNYIVTATTGNGCIVIDSVMVFVNPLTANAGMDKTIICGGTAQLDSVTSIYTGTGVLSYLWSPSIELNYDTISNPTATATSDTTYFVTVTTPNGCVATDSVTVYVNPLTANAGMDKTIICGGTAQFDSITSNYTGTGTLSYLWSPATGLNYDTIPNPSATVTGNTTYFVTVTTPNGCTAIDSVTVLVNLLAITGTDGAIICGDSTTLNTSANYTGTGVLTYSWLPTMGLDSSNVANPVATINSNQTYTVTVITPNGCIATDDVSVSIIPMNAPEICIVGVDSTNKNLIVWNKPVSNAIDSFFIYRETNITNVYQKTGAVSYDSFSIFSDTNSFPDVQSNKYKISIKDDCGLESDRSAPHNTMHLAINQGMGTTWNLIWNAYQGFTVSTYNVYRGSDPNNLQLIGTSSGSSTAYSDLIAPSGYLYYQVEVVSPNSCNPSKSYNTSRSNISTNNPNGIYENSNAPDLFSIHPNPSNDDIAVETFQKCDIDILNIEGQIIKSINGKENHTTIDISGFASGMYFVKVKTEKGVSVKKFVKQ